MTTQADIDRACFRLLDSPEFRALIEWWELGLTNAPVPADRPVDPLRLVMAQGDRERLLAVKMRADQHRRRLEKERTDAG